ncbi:MAG: hypothetical protein OXU64_03070 [Gemmatimonadota bacterium]|nr:hypothetical protein [Deltaproteobacteria bacterium]MDE2973695.1 hypothetical protein [Gemmatimonadota bacterium]
MPPELAPWISPAVIVGFMLYLNRRLESRMDRLESRMNRMDAELRERMAHLEGLLEGLREAITRRNVA